MSRETGADFNGRWRGAVAVLSLAFLVLMDAPAYAAKENMTAREDYIQAPLPAGFQVLVTEIEGPVFADANGRTLYKWPRRDLRVGTVGDVEFKASCGDQIFRETAGSMSPYPPGFELPEADTRPSCNQVWPPVLASDNAKPVDKWTVIDRPDGRKQWAYAGAPLYTSFLDKKPGDVLGASKTPASVDEGAPREPVGPEANVPFQFSVDTTKLGRLVSLRNGKSVYTYDLDSRHKSNCAGACMDGWAPVLSADYARPVGDWTTFERSPGVKQWAFKGMPVYEHLQDSKLLSLDGGDIAHWRNVYTQKAPLPPAGFVVKETSVGLVLGDERGRTIYMYSCLDDSFDHQLCDHPDAPQAYRFAMCGNGDPDQCLKAFPYVIARAGAKSGSATWSTMYINPKTGKRAQSSDPGALNVWAYRGRPVYTFAGRNGYGDETPLDLKAQNWGEFNGRWNGYRAIIYRDLYGRRDL